MSEHRACQLVVLPRRVLHYSPKPQSENDRLKTRLLELAERRRFGWQRLHTLVRREGFVANHKKVYLLCSAAELSSPKQA